MSYYPSSLLTAVPEEIQPSPALISYGGKPVVWPSCEVSMLESLDRIEGDSKEETKAILKDYLRMIPNTHTVPLGKILEALPLPAFPAGARDVLTSLCHSPYAEQLVQVRQKTPYLTVDIVPFYIDPTTLELSVFLGFKEGGTPENTGWAMAGTYVSVDKGDLNLDEAALRVIRDELGVPETEVTLLQPLGFVPDFLRDVRRSPAGPIYGALLKKTPDAGNLHLKKIVGIPLKVFYALIYRAPIGQGAQVGPGLLYPGTPHKFTMIWNHDSWLTHIFSSRLGKRYLSSILRLCRSAGVEVVADRRVAEDELECPICLDLYEEPTTLACGHTGCRGCLEVLDPRVCPFCRAPFTALPAVNFTLKKIIESS